MEPFRANFQKGSMMEPFARKGLTIQQVPAATASLFLWYAIE